MRHEARDMSFLYYLSWIDTVKRHDMVQDHKMERKSLPGKKQPRN